MSDAESGASELSRTVVLSVMQVHTAIAVYGYTAMHFTFRFEFGQVATSSSVAKAASSTSVGSPAIDSHPQSSGEVKRLRDELKTNSVRVLGSLMLPSGPARFANFAASVGCRFFWA